MVVIALLMPRSVVCVAPRPICVTLLKSVMAAATPAFGSLARPVELRLNAVDRDRIGVADGDQVRITSARGQLDLPVHADTGVAAGTADLAWNLPGAAAGALIDAAASVTDLRVESIR